MIHGYLKNVSHPKFEDSGQVNVLLLILIRCKKRSFLHMN